MRPWERTEREVNRVLEEKRLQGVRAAAERRVVHAAHLPRAARAVVAVTVHLTVAHEHHPRRERSVDARQVLLDPAELPRVGPAVHLGVYHGEVHTCLLERIPAVVLAHARRRRHHKPRLHRHATLAATRVPSVLQIRCIRRRAAATCLTREGARVASSHRAVGRLQAVVPLMVALRCHVGQSCPHRSLRSSAQHRATQSKCSCGLRDAIGEIWDMNRSQSVK